MHWEILVEEPSAEAALRVLLPKLASAGTFKIIRHQGKKDLLEKLPGRLLGYRRWLPANSYILVLIDLDDRADCHSLKDELEDFSRAASLVSKSEATSSGAFQIVNRLAIRELEAWFFGDVEALVEAYPRVPRTLGEKARYRDPDAIPHTWEALERVLGRAGYYAGGMPKIEVARRVALHMDPNRNRSRSFQVFRDTFRSLPTRNVESDGRV